jgi:tol-pal system protein YbgF
MHGLNLKPGAESRSATPSASRFRSAVGKKFIMSLTIFHRVLFIVFLLALVAAPLSADDQKDKDQREKIEKMAVQLEEMKTELTVLGRQVQSMQDTLNKTTGEMSTLITQMSDNISGIRRAHSTLSSTVTQISTSVSSVLGTTPISSVMEQIAASNQRMERLSEQFAQLKKVIEDIPKQPVLAQITPGNPEQLFAAAYSDYSRGNYDLALSEFRQYVETYPSSELADNAQYWIGEILHAQKKYAEAVTEFDRVSTISPKGDKVTIALYKKALVLLEMGKKEDGLAQLVALIKSYPKSVEASLATQQLQQLAPELLTPEPQPSPTPRKKK